MMRKVSGRLQSFSFSAVYLNPRPVRRTRTFDFYPPTTPGNFCFGIGDEAHVFWPSSAYSGRSPPARRDLASDTWTPHPRSRSTLCFRPFSMQAANRFRFYYLLLATTCTRTDTVSKEMARKVNILRLASAVQHLRVYRHMPDDLFRPSIMWHAP